MTQFETLSFEQVDKSIALITLNRPASANAMNTQMGKDLLEQFRSILMDPADLRCVVLTGAGTKAFCAGGDLRERNSMSDAEWQRQHVIFEQAFYTLMDCPVPVIAAVNGAAYGGGTEIALACDFIHAAETARFALTEPKLGIIPGGGGTQNLPRAVGSRRAKELIYSAQSFSAGQAAEWGMVNHVWPQQDLIPGVLALAQQIAANGPIAVRQAKRAMTVGVDTDLKTGLAIEIEAYNRTVPTSDRREGVLAFNEKRPPQFTGQ
ncbi:enoyl-CoA hydratase [Salipiger aestuarii]|uniref:Enoyl-CoA hydratase/carnithine racemase n=1 Tax=Salipiger aestuarii TaxID=568098 RepID=A0A327XCZ7_9RHOB|nr:enoyl-CoA hydratase-related protein [Salipiger aestuarii]EIE49009.1 enoyl CoA hydratase [Citreicella sp. 357]KAA8603222.1 enoyl-CoA hydratase [Salipiger aestuarii]KAA8605387.1 enoyl-CoA hydratase [Salipiger aestuarii]KAB2530366.1 enoyl-CoA hydratase [Salipiger aestuarii]RAK06673.1 enoyl-CoA hydratase/carnithine racemase [Salipiger aestuarii]